MMYFVNIVCQKMANGAKINIKDITALIETEFLQLFIICIF